MGGIFAEWESEVHQLLQTRDLQVDPDAIASIAQSSFESGDSPVSFVVKHRHLLEALKLKQTTHGDLTSVNEDREQRYRSSGWLIGWGIALGAVTIIGFALAVYGCVLEIQLRKEVAQDGDSYNEWTKGKRDKQALRMLGPIFILLVIGIVTILALTRR